MFRTFWPAKTIDDLPRAALWCESVNKWAVLWFGESVRVETPELISTDDHAFSAHSFAYCDGALCVELDDEYLELIISKFPSMNTEAKLLKSFTYHLVQDLVSVAFGSAEDEVGDFECHDRPEEYLRVRFFAGQMERFVITVYVSADAFFGETRRDQYELSPVASKLSGNVAVPLSVERDISLSVLELKELPADTFVPIGDAEDISFELRAGHYSIGKGYVGRCREQFAFVVEG